jgi:hypothetical protein
MNESKIKLPDGMEIISFISMNSRMYPEQKKWFEENQEPVYKDMYPKMK